MNELSKTFEITQGPRSTQSTCSYTPYIKQGIAMNTSNMHARNGQGSAMHAGSVTCVPGAQEA